MDFRRDFLMRTPERTHIFMFIASTTAWMSVFSFNAVGCTSTQATTSTQSTEITAGAGGGPSEVQDISFNVPAQDFTLTVGGQTTALMSGNASPPQVQSALNGLSTIDTIGGVTVASDGNGGYLVTYNIPNAEPEIQISETYDSCQVITFGAAPTVLAAGTGQVTASTDAFPSASYPIVFSTTSADCSVTTNGVVTGINAGTNNCAITASQAGDSLWQSATTIQVLSIQATTPVRLQSFGVE
jgi:hypothetical protein